MIRLADIIHVPLDWQSVHAIKAYEENDRSEVIEALELWQDRRPEEYKKIMRSIKMGCENKRVTLPKFVKQDSSGRPVFEFRADRLDARIYFFYAWVNNRELIVCTNASCETDHGGKRQRREFDRTENLRIRYLESVGVRP